MKKRSLWTLLMLCALLRVLSVSAWAAEADIPVSGVCGDGLTWTLEKGMLTVSGSGQMDDFAAEDSPWYLARASITSVVIDSGVTSIGENAFSGCRNLTEVTFRGDTPTIGENAFAGVISWGYYPRGNDDWDGTAMGNYGGLMVWKDYCDHTLSQWLSDEGYDHVLRSVCHRGSPYAPENTIAAYKLAERQGFLYVETDVQFTKDGVPVLLHDTTIDRTSNGTGYLTDYTYEELKQFDFGGWKSDTYAGTQIPTFEDFLLICRELSLKPYVEIKAGLTSENVSWLVELTDAYGVIDDVTWISFDAAALKTVAEVDPDARIGYLVLNMDESILSTAVELKSLAGEVFVSCYYKSLTEQSVNLVKAAGLPLEVWTVNDTQWIAAMDPYISGVTSDGYIAGKIVAEQSAEAFSSDVSQWRRCLWCEYSESRVVPAGGFEGSVTEE